MSGTSENVQSPPLAIVTGASSGIGRALARQFAKHGFDLVIAAENAELADAATELKEYGHLVTEVRVDLSTPAGVEHLVKASAELDRPVAAVALNAGIGVHGRFDETNLEDDLRLVDLNVRSTVHLAKLLVRPMVARGSGRLLFTSSIAATAPGPYHATYAASKAFIHSFAEAIRTELADTGVTVTSLQPGPTDTEFFDRADMQDTKVASGHLDDPDDVARQGFEALMAGKDHVVAGSFRNRLQTTASTVLPDKVASAMAGTMTKPGSGSGER
jgi:short-subunit dehydrogenase